MLAVLSVLFMITDTFFLCFFETPSKSPKMTFFWISRAKQINILNDLICIAAHHSTFFHFYFYLWNITQFQITSLLEERLKFKKKISKQHEKTKELLISNNKFEIKK